MNNILPVGQKNRTQVLDVLRAWALLGVVLMNYSEFISSEKIISIFDKGSAMIFSIIFSGKSWSLLSILFGYGFGLIIKKMDTQRQPIYTFFLRKFFWLLIFGVVNVFIFSGDILTNYAIMGLFFLLFVRISGRNLLILSLVFCCVINPFINAYSLRHMMPSDYYSNLQKTFTINYLKSDIIGVFSANLKSYFYLKITNILYYLPVSSQMLAMMLFGLGAQKIELIAKITENRKMLRYTFWISLLLSIIFMAISFTFNFESLMEFSKSYDCSYMITTSMMMFFASAIAWLYLAGKWNGFFKLISPMGTMTLTNYLVQNIIGLILFSGIGWGLSQKLNGIYYFIIGFAIYVAQIFFCRWWLKRYEYGPLEWLWRSLSYNKTFEFRKG